MGNSPIQWLFSRNPGEDKYSTGSVIEGCNIEPWTQTSTLHMNIPRSLIHLPKQARYKRLYLVLKYLNWKKYATLEKSALHDNIPRSFIHEPKQARYTGLGVVLHSRHTNINPWVQTSKLHPNIPRSFIHDPKKHASHEYTSFFNALAETSGLHEIISCSLILKLKEAHYTRIYHVL